MGIEFYDPNIVAYRISKEKPMDTDEYVKCGVMFRQKYFDETPEVWSRWTYVDGDDAKYYERRANDNPEQYQIRPIFMKKEDYDN